MHKLICKHCHSEFRARSRHRIFCSRKCYTGDRQPSGGDKMCPRCNERKAADEFYRNKSTADGLQCYCKLCTDAYNASYNSRYADWRDGYSRLHHVKQTYGLTEEAYQEMWNLTNGCCYICGKPESSLRKSGKPMAISVDHNAETGAVRGLLCRMCNTGIGCANHDPEILRKWIIYLEQHAS